MNQFFQSALGITTLGTDRALTSMMPSGSQRLSWTLPIFHQPNSVLWVRYILTSGIFSRLEGLDPDAEVGRECARYLEERITQLDARPVAITLEVLAGKIGSPY